MACTLHYSYPWLYHLAFSRTPLLFLREACIAAMLKECSLLAPKAKRALEIGSGTGDLAWRLVESRPDLHLTAIDLSPQMVRYASTRYRSPRLAFRVQDFWEATGNFDLILSMATWVFFPLERSLSKLKDLISPRGILAVITTKPALFSQVHRLAFRALTGIDLHLHDPRRFRAHLSALGFNVRLRSVSELEGSYLISGVAP